MQNQKKSGVSLDELAAGKLPKHILNSVSKLEITVADLVQWRSSQSPIHIAIKGGLLFIDIRLRVKIAKTIAIAGGTLGLIWGIIRFVVGDLPIFLEWIGRFTTR